MGLTTEAARAIVDFAADALDADRIFAVHAKENGASGRVLEKLGFIYQNDCVSTSFDGKRTFQSRLTAPPNPALCPNAATVYNWTYAGSYMGA